MGAVAVTSGAVETVVATSVIRFGRAGIAPAPVSVFVSGASASQLSVRWILYPSQNRSSPLADQRASGS